MRILRPAETFQSAMQSSYSFARSCLTSLTIPTSAPTIINSKVATSTLERRLRCLTNIWVAAMPALALKTLFICQAARAQLNWP